MQNIDDNFWNWVEAHINDDTTRLRLKYHSGVDINYPLAISQIECRHKYGKKLRKTLTENPRFLFPSKLSGEQSTSDSLAEFHASLIMDGKPMLDLTAGLGIDVLHCSALCPEATAIEYNDVTAAALQYNVTTMHRDNIRVVCRNCIDFLSSNTLNVGTIFIDPARRGENGRRLFALKDCEPDVTTLIPTIANHCKRLVVKMSPMLDISQTIKELSGCNRIISIGNTTECKELIAVKDFGSNVNAIPKIESITILQGDTVSSFSFTLDQETSSPLPECSNPSVGNYIYEPYPSMMKVGAIKLIGQRFDLKIFHPNTRLYHSTHLTLKFPGEIFIIENIVDFASKNIKRLKNEYPRLCISTRNFGMSADSLRQKLGVKDGGNLRLFAITDCNNRRLMIICKKTGN